MLYSLKYIVNNGSSINTRLLLYEMLTKNNVYTIKDHVRDSDAMRVSESHLHVGAALCLMTLLGFRIANRPDELNNETILNCMLVW